MIKELRIENIGQFIEITTQIDDEQKYRMYEKSARPPVLMEMRLFLQMQIFRLRQQENVLFVQTE